MACTHLLAALFSLTVLAAGPATQPASRPPVAIDKDSNIAYAKIDGAAADLTSLDVYAPAAAAGAARGRRPVMVMIHGGGWAIGDKSNAAVGADKAAYFVAGGYVYVSINYRLSPAVKHPMHVQDVAKAVAWVHDNAARYGGDANAIFVMGHSAGAHLAALVSTDERRLREAGKPLSVIKGAILLDGAGYDIPTQAKVAPGWLAMMYEAAFTKDPNTQKDASPLLHVAKGKGIPPFLILHVAERPDARGQAGRLAAALKAADVPAEVYAAEGKTHMTINRDIGKPGDGPTEAIMKFLGKLTAAK